MTEVMGVPGSRPGINLGFLTFFVTFLLSRIKPLYKKARTCWGISYSPEFLCMSISTSTRNLLLGTFIQTYQWVAIWKSGKSSICKVVGFDVQVPWMDFCLHGCWTGTSLNQVFGIWFQVMHVHDDCEHSNPCTGRYLMLFSGGDHSSEFP